ncbi:MAG: histidine phosphatase family protein [Candidatus Thalassarchaeaceae archaeon]|nr:histidine phosphatase family protein [Candidatus Thalassarchaeaceae archaeon]
MSRRLIVMRHAKSSWKETGISDHDRPLNKRGLRDAPRIADAIHDRGWTPDLILVSSSKRTLQTLSQMSNRFEGVQSEIRTEIYHATVNDLLLVLEDTAQEGTTMVLGHNPGSEILVNHLSGEWHVLPTAAAVLLVESTGQWEIQEVFRPKEIQ